MKTLSCFFLFFISCLFAGEQKVVLISGATGGLGRASANAFAEKGWKVWAGCRVIPEEEGPLNFVYLDVTDEQSIRSCIETILLEDGRIDALINNAGYGMVGPEECVSMQDAKKLFDVNFFGCVRLTQAVIPVMREQSSGHIVNISSTSGVRAVPLLGMYAASKFALEGYSESLAVTLSPWNIQVSIVEPGTVNNQWINHCVKVERAGEGLYAKATDNLIDRLSKYASSGQNPAEIGALIVQIAETEKVDMRYQTSEKVKDVVSKKLVDLSGNEMREMQQILFNSLIE